MRLSLPFAQPAPQDITIDARPAGHFCASGMGLSEKLKDREENRYDQATGFKLDQQEKLPDRNGLRSRSTFHSGICRLAQRLEHVSRG